MHILIINFNLHKLSHAEYLEICNEVAETFAALPGLISKHWIANKETNTYGGVYFWKNQQSMLDYKASEIFSELGSNPAFINMAVTDFKLLTSPTIKSTSIRWQEWGDGENHPGKKGWFGWLKKK